MPVTDWPAAAVEMVRRDSLRPYDRNARTHSDEQIREIAASIEAWGWTQPILVDEDMTVLAGHGRLAAAEALGIDEVPVVTARGWTQDQKRAYVLADNQIAANAGWDSDLLRIELEAIGESEVDVELTGFAPGVLDGLRAEVTSPSAAANPYTITIECPVYEPTGEAHEPAELYDTRRATELIERIEASDLPDAVRTFLHAAASRHVAFRYDRIAEFYARADPEVQRLMEDSALVIVDFDRAVESGYVRLSETMRAIAGRALAEGGE